MTSKSVELDMVMKMPPTRSPPLRNNREVRRATMANTNLKYAAIIYLRCIKYDFYAKFIFPEL